MRAPRGESSTAARASGNASIAQRSHPALEEEPVTSRALPPYHLAEQHAAALLPPCDAQLAELESRLTNYVRRVRMSDADRQVVEEARDAVAQARARLSQLAAGARGAGDAP